MKKYFRQKVLKRKRPFGISRYIWEDNIENNLYKIECENVALIYLDQD